MPHPLRGRGRPWLKTYLELPVTTSSHGDLMLPLVEVQEVKVILKDEFSRLVSLLDSTDDAGSHGEVSVAGPEGQGEADGRGNQFYSSHLHRSLYED